MGNSEVIAIGIGAFFGFISVLLAAYAIFKASSSGPATETPLERAMRERDACQRELQNVRLELLSYRMRDQK